MVCALIREGAEGGSWDAIERAWTIPRWEALRRHYRTSAPPLYASLAALTDWKPEGPAVDEHTLTDPAEIFAAFRAMEAQLQGRG